MQCAIENNSEFFFINRNHHFHLLEFEFTKKFYTIYEKKIIVIIFMFCKNHINHRNFLFFNSLSSLTFDVWVLKLDSVAKPFPQMLQWKGRFFALSTWASWLRKCCCKLLNWMKARPHSWRWHLYGRSPRSGANITTLQLASNLQIFIRSFAFLFVFENSNKLWNRSCWKSELNWLSESPFKLYFYFHFTHYNIIIYLLSLSDHLGRIVRQF